MIISAILLFPVSYALRIIYGRQWIAWEDRLVESLGINTTAYYFIKITVLVIVAGYLLIRERRKRRKQKSQHYELPKS